MIDKETFKKIIENIDKHFDELQGNERFNGNIQYGHKKFTKEIELGENIKKAKYSK